MVVGSERNLRPSKNVLEDYRVFRLEQGCTHHNGKGGIGSGEVSLVSVLFR